VKKTYIISGGTSGIGLSIVNILSKNKNNVIISLSRNESKIEKAKKIISNNLAEVKFMKCDISRIDELNRVFQEIKQYVSRIDGLVNNAGIIKAGGIEQLSIEDWDNTMQLNLSSMFYVTKTFLPLMKNSTSSIVNISSISSMLSGASISYSVSKAGVDMLTKVLARELAKYKIRVNAVNPGITKTGFQVTNNLIDENSYNSFLSEIGKTYPLGLGEPNDIANVINFLLSDKSKWMTGSIIVVDGGRIVNS